MKRPILLCLAAAFVVACQDQEPPTAPPDLGGPLFEIKDGARGGNDHFFFLPPIVRGRPVFTGVFDGDLPAVVEICKLNPEGTDCLADQPAGFPVVFTTETGTGSQRIRVIQRRGFYMVLWRTRDSDLEAGMIYRIRVLVGETDLGHADVKVVDNFQDFIETLIHERDEFIPLSERASLPLLIRFRIEEGALCESEPCTTETVDLAQGGTVVLEETGDRIDIPAQGPGAPEVAVTMQPCTDPAELPIDLPKFGNCIRITADPPLSASLDPPATVSVCSAVGLVTGLTEQQEDLLMLHRLDEPAGDVFALPLVADFCPEPVGSLRSSSFPQFARAGWQALRDRLAALVSPRALFASAVVWHDRDKGGSSPTFSSFQFALPAKMEKVPDTDNQTAVVNTPVPIPPAVHVTDARDGNVADATVRFEVTLGDGTVVPTEVLSNGLGIAQVTSWALGPNPGTNTLKASGRGIADPVTNGPQVEVFDPFWPDFDVPAVKDEPVLLETGQVEFTATGVTDVGFRATFTNDVVGQPPGPPEVGTWTLSTTGGTILVQEGLGNLTTKPVVIEKTQLGGLTLKGTVAGTPPNSGAWLARWRSVQIEPRGSGVATSWAFRASNGRILATAGYTSAATVRFNGDPSGVGFTSGVSQLFEMTFDFDQKTTSLSIDGVPVAVDPFLGEVPATDLATFDVSVTTTSGQFGWDDIEVVRAVAPPPLSNQIVFSSLRDGPTHIFVMGADGSNPTKLTTFVGLSTDPAVSPDGTKIAFTSSVAGPTGGNFEVFVMNADGSNPVNLTNNPATAPDLPVIDNFPAWSPDGTKIAFRSTRDGDNAIFIMDADGSNVTRLTLGTQAAWSPDGTKIAYTSNGFEIFVINADGLTSPANLTNNAAFDAAPSWSPDGTKIAFWSTRDGAGNGLQNADIEIYVMNADGSSVTRLTNNSVRDDDPEWSPDGLKIAFTSARDGNNEVYVMNADGSNQVNLTNNAANDKDPAWGPIP